tara:strand:+ start:575 stop:1123 length:549 start_codon:yes stop_codon:yes gene_type:complete
VSFKADQQLPTIAIVMGSDSDLDTLQPGIKILEDFGIHIEVRILSAHRTPNEMIEFAKNAESKGLKVIIAGAGGAAHLPGMIASLTSIPVIGVPIQTKSLSGVDSMHSILQMPAGIPVATVAIGGGLNSGLLAAQILGIYDSKIKEKLFLYRQNMHNQVIKKNKSLQDYGSTNYLKQIKEDK